MKAPPHYYPAVGAAKGRSKGATFREFTRWAVHEYGQDRMIEIWSRLPPHLQELVNPHVDGLDIEASNWYTAELPNTLLNQLLSELPEEEQLRVIREGTRYALGTTLRGPYRFLFRVLMSPERLAQHIQKIWDLHYDSGIDVWMITEPGRIETRIMRWVGHNKHVCQIVRESSVVMLEMLGCKDVVATRTRCVDRGHRECEGIITYK